MFRYLSFVILLITGAGFSACSFGLHKTIEGNNLAVKATENVLTNPIDSIVRPYKLVLDKEMNEIIGKAEVDFIPTRPNSNLGNLLADVMLEKGKTFLPDENLNIICVLNFGGMRSTLNKGDLSLGDVFKVLPFDNQLVVVKMKATSIYLIQKWIKESNGHPISGFSVGENEILKSNGKIWDSQKDFWVVTSDYLLNGGDKADFFSEKIDVKYTDFLVRDVFIEYLKYTKSLHDSNEERIKF